MRVGHIDDLETANPLAIDATVRQPGHGFVAYLDDQAVGTIEVEGELFEPVGCQLMASRLRQAAELLKVGSSPDLAQPQLDLLCTLSSVPTLELPPVAEQVTQPPAVETDFQSTPCLMAADLYPNGAYYQTLNRLGVGVQDVLPRQHPTRTTWSAAHARLNEGLGHGG